MAFPRQYGLLEKSKYSLLSHPNSFSLYTDLVAHWSNYDRTITKVKVQQDYYFQRRKYRKDSNKSYSYH
jgi:hypothetical protein